MLLWGLWRGEDAPKNTAKLRRAASETKRNDINEQLAPLCTTTITKAVTCRGRETEDDVLVHFLFALWLFFFFSFFFVFFCALRLCVIFSLLLIKCTTSVINFASSGNCSVCNVCVCVCVCASYATTALATTITITTTTPRGVERDVSPNHSCKEEQCEGRKGWGGKQTKRIEIEMKIEYNKYENCTAQRRLRVKAARVAQLLRSCARDAASRLLSLCRRCLRAAFIHKNQVVKKQKQTLIFIYLCQFAANLYFCVCVCVGGCVCARYYCYCYCCIAAGGELSLS